MRQRLILGILALLLASVESSINAAEEKLPSDGVSKKGVEALAADNLSLSLSKLDIQTPVSSSVKKVNQEEITIIPGFFESIEFNVEFKGGTAHFRSLKPEDINQTYIERFYTYDPSDFVMAHGSPDNPLPTIEVVQQMLSDNAKPDHPNGPGTLYGIFNHEDHQVIGQLSFCKGRFFYNAIESTIRIPQKFRGAGLGTAILKGVFEVTQQLVSTNPCQVSFIEASINGNNYGSIKSHMSAGMLQFQDELYYYPLLGSTYLPVRMPSESTGSLL